MQLEHQAPRDGGPQPIKAAQLQFMRRVRQQFAARRRWETSACVLALLGIVLMLAENEVVMGDLADDSKRAVVLALKCAVAASTVLLEVVLVLQFQVAREIRQLQTLKPSTRNRFPTLRRLVVLLELLVCGFHIPPGVSGSFQVRQRYGFYNAAKRSCQSFQRGLDPVLHGGDCYLIYRYPVEALGVFMIIRLYLLARFVRSSSSLYSQWVAFVGELNDINTLRPFFHFKAIFKIRPLRVLVPLTAISILFTAAIIRILERPVQRTLENFWEAVWMIMETLSTTGFGDCYPVTYLGRAFTVIGAMLGGLMIIALIQSLFFGVLDFSPSEQTVKHLIDMERWNKAVARNAALVVQTTWKYHRQQRPDYTKRRLFELLSKARELRADKPVVEKRADEMISEMEGEILTEMNRLSQQQSEVLARIQEKALELEQRRQELQARRR